MYSLGFGKSFWWPGGLATGMPFNALATCKMEGYENPYPVACRNAASRKYCTKTTDICPGVDCSGKAKMSRQQTRSLQGQIKL